MPRRALPLLLALLLAAPTPAPAKSKPKAPAEGKPIAAYLVRIEGTTLRVTLGDKGTEVLIPTDDQTHFTVDGQPAKLADLKPQMYLRIVQQEGLTAQIDAKFLLRNK